MNRLVVYFLIVCILGGGHLFAAEPRAVAGAEASPRPKSQVPASAQGDLLDSVREPVQQVDRNYKVQPTDKVSVKIFPDDQYVRGGQYEVTPEGNITLPLIGKFQIAGKTLSEASDALVEIIDRDYIVGPEVVIEMIGYKQETFVVLGQVQKPGTLNIPSGTQGFTFLQAISLAGGFSQVANIKKIKIIRQENGQRKIIRVNAESIISGESEDIVIKPGDVIHVSESIF